MPQLLRDVGLFVLGGAAVLVLQRCTVERLKNQPPLPRGPRRPPVRFLTDADVARAVPWPAAVEASRAAFLAEAEVPLRHRFLMPEHDGVTLVKPARVTFRGGGGGGDEGQVLFGVKVVNMRPRNGASGDGLNGVVATILLQDDASGLPLAVVDGTFLTGMRTAAGSAAVADVMVQEGATRLAVFGAGLQAECHVHAMLVVRPCIRIVAIVNRSPARAEDLARRLRQEYPKLQVLVCGAQEALAGVHIVCTCTNAAAPVLLGAWLPSGCHVAAVGSYLPNTQEVDSDVIARAARPGAALCMDSEEALQCGDLAVPVREGIAAAAAFALARDVLGPAGGARFRRAPEGGVDHDAVTFFKSVGTAVQDVVTAQAAVVGAERLGVGQMVQL